jgi:hypothetical protein
LSSYNYDYKVEIHDPYEPVIEEKRKGDNTQLTDKYNITVKMQFLD